MPKPFKVSIIIPVYNEQDYLADCLNSISRQSVMPDEVIVIDNNSTDKSKQIAKRYDFVKLVDEPEQGVLYARNTGFDMARHELIGRIDADTRLPKDWVANTKKVMQNKSFAAATGPVYYYDMPLGHRNYWIDHKIRQALYRGDKKAPFLFGSNSVVRKDAWNNVKTSLCHTAKVHEDLDLAIHLAQQGGKILYSRDLLAGASARRYDDGFRAFKAYMGMYLNSYQKHGINRLSPRVATMFYWLGYVSLWFVQRSRNPKTGKYSLRQLRYRRRARKNPMAG